MGRLDVEALHRSLQAVVDRHEVLRSTFPERDGAPVQIVNADFKLALPLTDLSEASALERDATADRLLGEHAAEPFDLAAGPLIRALLVRVAADEHLLALTLHHSVTDGWSRSILARELGAVYTSISTGPGRALPRLPIQYADFAVWQRNRLQGEALDRLVSFWRAQLDGAPAVLDLPTDRPRPAAQTFAGERLSSQLSSSLSAKIVELSRRCSTTPFMTLLTAFSVLLGKYSGQDDLVVGIPVANRTRPEVEGLIGFFTNTLPIRADLSGDPAFSVLLSRVREAALQAYEHQELPFERLVEELQPVRSPSHSPVFQAMFLQMPDGEGALQLPGLRIEPVSLERSESKQDLTLGVRISAAGLDVGVEYNTDLFGRPRMERLLRHYELLLEYAVANPEAAISRIGILPEDERRNLICTWNDTTVEWPRFQSVVELFDEQVRRHPLAAAVELADEAIDYATLDRRASAVAACLVDAGVRPGAHVALCGDRSIPLIVGMLGILKAGAAYVPIDATYPAERVAFMLQDTRAAAAVVAGRATRPILQAGVPVIEAGECGERAAAPAAVVSPALPAYVIYTSGSTGKPKGVQMPHKALVNLLQWQQSVLPGATRTLQFTSIGFDVSFQEILSTLCSGGTLVLIGEEERRDPAALLSAVEAGRVERLFVPFAVLHTLAMALNGRPVPCCLREVITAGEQLRITPEIADMFAGPTAPALHNHYGPTEAHVVTAFELTGHAADWSPAPPIGRPIANVRIYLLDKLLQPVPTGVTGELYIGGCCLAHGYVGRADLTAARFVPDPFSAVPGCRLYRTGDIARYLEGGTIEFIGRADHQVKIRGYRVEPGEIEARLLEHPAVREAAVMVYEDGPSRRGLLAYVAADGVSIADLRAHVASSLPDYMVPAGVVFLDALPLTPNGKLDRAALPPPGGALAAATGAPAGPRTLVEEAVAQIVQEALSLDSIGAHDNFFDLGGHSLAAAHVISRIRSAFATDLPLKALFEAPTVAGLAACVSAARGMAAISPPIRRAESGARCPLSFAQQRLWFINQLEPESAVYNVPIVLRISGALEVPALERGIEQLARRHAVLRSRIRVLEGTPAQEVCDDTPALRHVDLTRSSAGDPADEVRAWMEREATQAFNLDTGPMYRAVLLRLADDRHVLLLTMHHIVADGWSTGIWMSELAALYEAFHAGKPSPLVPLPVQYADYALWQRESLQGDVLDQQLAYWVDQLRGAPGLLELPTDRPRPAVLSFRGARTRLEIPEETTRAIHRLSRRAGVTPYMTLLAAFQALLARYTGQRDIVVGTPVANRSHRDVEGLIGFFVNTLAMRANLEDDPTFTALLARTREVALGAFDHQDLPFERLVEELQPERSLSHSPVFQVLFGYQQASDQRWKLDGLEVDSTGRDAVTSKFDLHLIATERSSRIVLSLEYNTDLFDAARMERLLAHMSRLIDEAVANPDQRVMRIPLLSATERIGLMAEACGATLELPADMTVDRLIAREAERVPDAPAIHFANEVVTYRALNARANQLAHHLMDLGIGPESFVCLCIERSADMLVGLLAILKAGGAYVPLDASLPLDRLAFLVEDTQAAVILASSATVDCLPNSWAHIMCLDTDWWQVEAQSEQDIGAVAGPDNAAYVIYTSGSTGRPKGVVVPHRGVVNYLAWAAAAYTMQQGSGTLVDTPLTFDLTVTSLLAPLTCGQTVHLLPQSAGVDGLCDALQGVAGVSLIKTTPAHLDAMRNLLPASAAGAARVMVVGGDALRRETLALWADAVPPVRIINEYGPTETVVGCCVYDALSGSGAGATVPIGRPIANARTYVLDGDLALVPGGVTGELCIGGICVTRGYLNRPDLTAERFVPDPFAAEPGSRMYRSGDLARRLPAGDLEYVGRTDSQVKIRGYRVELGEIETVLSECTGVAAAAAAVREDDPGDKQLVAYVVGSGLTAEAIRRQLSERLPAYMVPAAIVILDAMPLTAHGKVDRRALPAPEQATGAGDYEPPHTATEERVASIWCEVLRADRVGVMAGFFEIGGHSLLAAQVIARIRTVFDVELPLQSLFDAPTIAGLADRIDAALAERARSDEERLLQLLADIDHLSEDEATARLELL